MVAQVLFLASLLLNYSNFCQENLQIIRSKKFDCSYVVSIDKNTNSTIITPFIDKKNEPSQKIELIESMSFIDVIEEEQYESLLCYSKNDPYVIYYVSLRGNGISRISIEHVLSLQSDARYMAILDENKRMYVHGMTVDRDTIFLAVSVDENEFGSAKSFILALYMARSAEKQIKILPMFILPITDRDTYYNCGVQNIKKLCSMRFDQRTQTLLCALEIETVHSEKNLLSALLCIGVQSQEIKDDSGKVFIAKHLSATYFNMQDVSQPKDIYSLSIDNIQHMETSTALSYIVFSDKNKNNSVYTLPLSNKGIASRQQKPKDIFFVEGLKRFVYRLFIEPADSLADIDINNSGCCVGNNKKISGIKKTIKVFGDSVIILVEKQYENEFSYELYKSIALFDSSGCIKGWTNWEILHHQKNVVIDFELDRLSGEIIIVEKNDIKKIGWNQYQEIEYPLLIAIDEILKNDHLIKHATMESVSDDTGSRILFGLVTDNIIFLANLNNAFFLSSRYEEIGNIGYISIADDNHIFIAGSNGVAHVVFDEQNKNIIVKKIFDQSDVKKVFYDQGIIYALTSNQLYRASFIKDGPLLKWENILCHEQKKDFGKLHDFIISGEFALLFSLKELLVIKSGESVRFGMPQFEVFLLPEQIGAPLHFSFISQTGRITDIGKGIGGNLFVLCANFSLERSQLYRLTIMPSEKNKVQLFDDIVLENKRGPFLNFGSLQKKVFTDGYRFLLLASQKQVSLSTQPRVGIVMSGNKLVNLPIQDFQNVPILYTGINPCTGEFFVVTEKSVHIYH